VVSSAGTRPSGKVNQLAISVMKEFGVDISNQKSKIITRDIIRNVDFLLSSENQINLNKSRLEEGIYQKYADPLLVCRAVALDGFRP
jgi:protein-tyrosine-phosphatase